MPSTMTNPIRKTITVLKTTRTGPWKDLVGPECENSGIRSLLLSEAS
jgi:hypothetical protein